MAVGGAQRGVDGPGPAPASERRLHQRRPDAAAHLRQRPPFGRRQRRADRPEEAETGSAAQAILPLPEPRHQPAVR